MKVTFLGKAVLASIAMLSLSACDQKGEESKDEGAEVQGAETLSGEALLQSFSTMALGCIHKEYPNNISHYLTSDADVKSPSAMHPIFYGCLDWHSAVHGHWMLLRLLALNPDMQGSDTIISALDKSFALENGIIEAAYFDGRKRYERPYGWAWLLQLSTELRAWDHAKSAQWLAAIKPIEDKVLTGLDQWLKNLVYPVRSGEHSQTAFAFGLAIDYARAVANTELEAKLTKSVMGFYGEDQNCPIGYEPSGSDFLSPCLMEADLMRRVMEPEAYGVWLSDFLPSLPEDGSGDWIAPGVVLDATDGKLVHLDGLNLSRAWALEGIASALPQGDLRRDGLMHIAAIHQESGIKAVSNSHYMGSHWLASFAVYLTTERGVE